MLGGSIVKNYSVCAVLGAAFLISIMTATVSAADTQEPQIQTSASLTEEWFGDGQAAGVFSEKTLQKWQPVADAYAQERENNFLGIGTCKEVRYGSRNVPVLEASAPVDADAQTRSECVAAMADRMGIEVTDAETTVLLRDVTEDGAQTTLRLYEWTFFEYIDPEGDGVTTDVSGYGVEHTVVLERNAFGYEIISDTYDEGDLTGMQSADYEEEEIPLETGSLQEQQYAAYQAGYDPAKAAAYADKYVKNGISGTIDESAYNLKDYISMNGRGGDCTNFVSQCIYAGGMPMDGVWFYKNADYFSGEWSTSRRHYPYMSGRGKAINNPSSKDIFLGCPVYYQSGQNISHTTICVGKNSAGVPIVDSHNKDYYHVRWNYWGDSTHYYTVQLTKTNGTGNAAVTPAPATPRPVISTNVLGDLNDNGKVDAGDALESLKGIVGLYKFTEKDMEIGDVNGNGVIDATDALLVLKKTVSLIDAFPAEAE